MSFTWSGPLYMVVFKTRMAKISFKQCSLNSHFLGITIDEYINSFLLWLDISKFDDSVDTKTTPFNCYISRAFSSPSLYLSLRSLQCHKTISTLVNLRIRIKLVVEYLNSAEFIFHSTKGDFFQLQSSQTRRCMFPQSRKFFSSWLVAFVKHVSTDFDTRIGYPVINSIYTNVVPHPLPVVGARQFHFLTIGTYWHTQIRFLYITGTQSALESAPSSPHFTYSPKYTSVWPKRHYTRSRTPMVFFILAFLRIADEVNIRRMRGRNNFIYFM